MQHQPVEFRKRRPAVTLAALADGAHAAQRDHGVLDGLLVERVFPQRPGDREDGREMREVVADGLRLASLQEFHGKGADLLAADLRAGEAGDVVGLDGSEHLALGAAEGPPGRGDVVVDDLGERRVGDGDAAENTGTPESTGAASERGR